MVNAAYPPAMPNYVPMMNDELYPAMHMQAPQYLPQQANAAALGMPEVLWSPYYGNTELVPQHYELDPRAFAMHQHAMPLNGNQDQMNAATAAHLSAPLAASSSNASSSPQPSSSSEPSERISDEPFSDDHKWRKYGQKQVKRSPYPRNYYKCTISGCPAKKHLEKFWDAAANKERCRTIYIGEHVHPVAISPQVYAATQADFRNSVLAQSTKVRAISFLHLPSTNILLHLTLATTLGMATAPAGISLARSVLPLAFARTCWASAELGAAFGYSHPWLSLFVVQAGRPHAAGLGAIAPVNRHTFVHTPESILPFGLCVAASLLGHALTWFPFVCSMLSCMMTAFSRVSMLKYLGLLEKDSRTEFGRQ